MTQIPRLPIGYDNFGTIITNKFDLVDKSLFIKDVIDDPAQIIVITRPRRFGKTLNLSMLQYFFAKEAYGESTEGLFEGFEIMNQGEEYLQHYRKYPVIFISLKDVKDHTFENTYLELCGLLQRVYRQHRSLLESDCLSKDEKKFFENILYKRADPETIKSALYNLTEYLFRVTGMKSWVLIDEYDSPIQSSYVNDYYDEMISFMRQMLGMVLKTNPYLHKAVITGILRISKESLFSGLNNLKVYSILNDKYASYFGFTETETNSLIQKYGLKKEGTSIKDWYNGYQFGDTIVYNPWSIVNYFDERDLKPYWTNTSDNQLMRNLLVNSSESLKDDFEILIQEKTVDRFIDENIVFGDLKNRSEVAVWSLLLMTGYLKVVAQSRSSLGLLATLKIPNREVNNLYRQMIVEWAANDRGVVWYNEFLNNLLSGKIKLFESDLQKLLEETVSIHDTAKEPEAFYHGLMLGFTASLHNHPDYEIVSNRESGSGRYDYLILSRDKRKPSIIFEFKRVKAEEGIVPGKEKLEKAAKDALAQITKQNYGAQLKQRDLTQVIKIGLAFSGKSFCLLWEE